MLREMMHSKIHGARVTYKNLHYTGSLAIDASLMEEARIVENEKIQVVNLANGERLWTYAIQAEPGSGRIGLNGGMAHKGEIGDALLIITYVQVNESELAGHRPRVLVIGEDNLQFERREG